MDCVLTLCLSISWVKVLKKRWTYLLLGVNIQIRMIAALPRQRQGVKIKQIPRLTVPEKISQLNFSHNDIRSIPAHLSAAKHLQLLDLSHNRITSVQHLPQLVSLKAVNLSYNLLTGLPSKMDSMVELQCLDVRFNRVNVLASLKGVKELVRVRMVEKREFFEIRADGNPVMTRKNSRQIFEKWLNPCLQNEVNVTRRRIAMSLQAPKDGSFLQTYRSQCLQSRSSSSQHHKRNISQVAPSSTSRRVPSPEITIISPNLAITESDQKPNTKIQASPRMPSGEEGVEDMRGLEEWFIGSMDVLHHLHSSFQLMATNQDTLVLEQSMRQLLSQQGKCTQKLIEQIIEYLKCALDGTLTTAQHETHLSAVSSLNTEIKLHHQHILNELEQQPQTPLRIYKPWVGQFRKLKILIQQVPLKITHYQAAQQRHKIIMEMSSISPEKPLTMQEIAKDQRKNTEQSLALLGSPSTQRQLNQLLFSKSQEDNLLLSDEKSHLNRTEEKKPQQSHSAKKGQAECDSCQLMKWEQAKLRQQIEELRQQKNTLESQNKVNLLKIERLQQLKVRYAGLSDKQQLIIDELEGLQPSTYQNILLEQAKTIEMMMGQGMSQCRWDSRATPQQASIPPKQQPPNPTSEFTCFQSRQLPNPFTQPTCNSSYFKNKLFVTTVNQTQEQSTKQRDEEKSGKEVVVSQFEGVSSEGRGVSSKMYTQSSHQSTHQQVITEEGESARRKSIKHASHLQSNKSKQKNQNSNKSRKQAVSQQREPLQDISNRTEAFSAKRSNQNSHTARKQVTQTFSKPNSKHSIASSHSLKHPAQVRPNPYLPMLSKQKDDYKLFVQYHLRNNIIDILSKKNNLTTDSITHPPHHKFIHKDFNPTKRDTTPRRESIR